MPKIKHNARGEFLQAIKRYPFESPALSPNSAVLKYRYE